MIMTFGSNLSSLLGHPYALARTAIRDAIAFYVGKERSFTNILDVGCGSMPYRQLFPDNIIYHGLEINQSRKLDNPDITYWYDGSIFPINANTYGLVICSQVLEHAKDPDLLLSEIYRVLMPGGSLILSVPFFWPEHEQPYDFQRFTSFGLVERLSKAGFTNILLRKTNPGLACLMQLAIEWLESQGRHCRGRRAILWRLAMSPLYAFLNITGFLYRGIPCVAKGTSEAELFLDLVVRAHRP